MGNVALRKNLYTRIHRVAIFLFIYLSIRENCRNLHVNQDTLTRYLYLKIVYFAEIYLRFYGAADVYWTESETTGTGDKQETRTVTYSNHETYFEYKVPVWTSGELCYG